MKVIKQGTPRGDRLWRGVCRQCRSTIEAKESELNVTDSQRDGPFAWAVCIACKAGSNDTGYGGVCFYPVKES